MKHERTQQEIEEMETARDLQQDEQEPKGKPLRQIADVIRTDLDSDNVVRDIFGLPRKQPAKARLGKQANNGRAAELVRRIVNAQERTARKHGGGGHDDA